MIPYLRFEIHSGTYLSSLYMYMGLSPLPNLQPRKSVYDSNPSLRASSPFGGESREVTREALARQSKWRA